MRRASLGICLLGLFVLACDAQDPLAPQAGGPRISADYVYTFGSYEVVRSSDLDFLKISNAHVIGTQGGRVALGMHELVVPPGAVSSATVFRITKTIGQQIVLDLHATDRATGAVVDSFARPVELRLSYRFAPIRPQDLNHLVVLWLKDNDVAGELVPVPTRIDRRTKHVVGSLTHFSQYAMGLN